MSLYNVKCHYNVALGPILIDLEKNCFEIQEINT